MEVEHTSERGDTVEAKDDTSHNAKIHSPHVSIFVLQRSLQMKKSALKVQKIPYLRRQLVTGTHYTLN